MPKFRLWDTENKKMVRAKNSEQPYKALQVRTNEDGSKLYVYDHAKWIELQNPQSADVKTYGPVWKSLTDEEVGYYLTNEPTDLYSWDSGDEASYRFMNGTTVLQSGKVDEGETPEYTGETPTKAATAQYTYTFSGWDPTVGPIYKKTDFKAQFASTVNEYTVSITSNDTDYGTVDVASVANVPYGTAISAEDNVLTIGEGESKTEVTATAEDGCVFSGWGILPATVTGDLTITATFTYQLSNRALEVNPGVIYLFVDDDTEPTDFINMYTETDGETGDTMLYVEGFGVFAEETEANSALVGLMSALDLEVYELLFCAWPTETVINGTINADFMAAVQTAYNNPTEANWAIVEGIIDDAAQTSSSLITADPEPVEEEGEK